MDEAQVMQWVDQYQHAHETPIVLLTDQQQQVIGKICRIYRTTGADRGRLFKEIVYQLRRSASSANEKENPDSRIYRIALTTAIVHNIITTSKSPDTLQTLMILTDQKAELINALKQLADDDKAIITLYLEGLNYSDIAAITGLAETIVGVKLNRIKKKVQQLLNTNEQVKLKNIWYNMHTGPKNSAELTSLIPNRPVSIFNILNVVTPLMLSKAMEKGSDMKKCLEEALTRIRSAALLSIASRTVIIGSVLLLAWFVIPATVAKGWILASAFLLFAVQITLLSKTWKKRIDQMKFTINHFRSQRVIGKKGQSD